MPITYENNTFHLTNNEVSYIFTILENKQLGHLYYGKKIKTKNTDNMLQLRSCVLAPSTFLNNLDFSLEVLKQEYPAYGTGDYRDPAFQLRNSEGNRITNFEYVSHCIYDGKKDIPGLPHTYASSSEATSLEVTLYDSLLDSTLILIYSIFEHTNSIVRSARFINNSKKDIFIERMMSCSVDFYDYDYEMIQLDGAWARERHIHTRKLQYGIQSIASTRGTSSAMHNPFFALKRTHTTENSGEVYGFNFVYSGNFLGQVQVDNYDVSRIMMGIHPFEFEWCLEPGESFHSPEVVMTYSDQGLSGMSQQFHDLYRNNLMRGPYKDKTRPILINNWEATYFQFNEESILNIASKAKGLGVELFVLDDGWFGKRNDDTSSLGDWYENLEKLPNGIKGLASKINDLGLKFGLWFEPEMVNEASNLYLEHPQWAIHSPGRNRSYGRNQFVLDFSNPEVVEHIYQTMYQTISSANIEYIKWDMNRNITEACSLLLPAKKQKEFFHRYILGVYHLYEKLITAFPNILFESCASGGARFDAGMLYYAPQAWTSDDTDAIERLKIQTGTSLVYPLVSMGSHVSGIPNHQVSRKTSLDMRANVAYFGTFGYELDVNRMPIEEQEEVRKQICFFKEHRELIQFGDFYRLEKGERDLYSWMVVSKDKKKAILGCYKVLATPNPALKKVSLQGLHPDYEYSCTNRKGTYYGDELMHCGFQYEIQYTGSRAADNYQGQCHPGIDEGDFNSYIYVLEAIIKDA